MRFSLVGLFPFDEAFSGRIWEREEILSINSRNLNEITNVVGIFHHRQLDTPDQPCKKHWREEHLSGQEHRFGVGRRPSGVRISILVWGSREYLCVVFLAVIRSESLSESRLRCIYT